MGCDVEECVGCACGVGWVGAMLWRECGVRYLWYCGCVCVCVCVCVVTCLLGIVECLELTRAFADTYVCDCGIVWRLMVLGVEWQRAGGRAVCGEGLRGERDAGRAGFVVCGCDALFVWCAGWRRRVKFPAHACCGVRVELGSCDGGSWIGTSARCVCCGYLWVLGM